MALSPLIPKRGMAEDSSCSLHLHQPSLHRATLNLHPNSESCVLVYWGQSIGEIVTPRSLEWTTPLVCTAGTRRGVSQDGHDISQHPSVFFEICFFCVASSYTRGLN